jgi:hypothetical protein
LRRAAFPLTTGRLPLPAILLAGALAACSDDPVPLRIRAIVDGAPVPGIEVTAFPYDAARLLDSLAALHDAPRPDLDSLERELLAFSLEPATPDDTAGGEVRAIRDSVAALADSLRASDRRSRGYPEAYHRFRQLYGRLVQRSAARESAQRGARDPLRALALRAGRAADSLRAWEHAAYTGLDSAAALEEDHAGRSAVAGMTDADGWVTLVLGRGAWWLDARLEHGNNPFAEYTWAVPVVVTAFPFRALLSEATGRITWRH